MILFFFFQAEDGIRDLTVTGVQTCALPISPTNPTGGIVSWTARVSIARWNLKEAAGKALARRTEIAYEACNLGEKADIFKVRYLYGKIVCRCGGHKREGEGALPGEVCNFA